jgi:hypothetical protein
MIAASHAESLRPTPADFRSVKNLVRRVLEDRTVSVDDREVPDWQRGSVWNDEQQGLLALSIVQGYPIGQIILWAKPETGVMVPVDGRQRITAIVRFYQGEVSIPDQPYVPADFRGRMFTSPPGADPSQVKLLPSRAKDNFEDYELALLVYPKDSPKASVMEIFVRLQGGTPLNKAEIRAALGGGVRDFVSELTAPYRPPVEDEEEAEVEERPEGHRFFQLLSKHLKNRRKSHRSVCDLLLHEYLHAGSDKHWQSLLDMYRADSLTDSKKKAFRTELSNFTAASLVGKRQGPILSPHLASAYLILTFFRAWRTLRETYALPRSFHFADEIDRFEKWRQAAQKTDLRAGNFTQALSNAGYAKNRTDERHEILMAWLLKEQSGLVPKDKARSFDREQKLAVWWRADKRCEWREGSGGRCTLEFADFKDADADHFVKWADGGPTTVDNGRLLCRKHNRAGK